MQTALIWGASGGMGRALVAQLQEAGWQVLAVARNDAALAGPNLETYSADISRESDVAAASHWAAQHADQVDLWVYAAGDILAKTTADTSNAEWDRIMAANLGGARYATMHSLPLVAPGGLLVYIGAYVSAITLPRLGAYAAAKGALEGFVGALAKEVRDRRISLLRVGAVDTPFWEKVPFKPPRQGTRPPADVATAILEAYTTGHKGPIDL